MKKGISKLVLSSALAIPLVFSGCKTEIVPLREHVEELSKMSKATEENICMNYASVLKLIRYDSSPVVVQDGLDEKWLVRVVNDENKVIYVDVKNNLYYDNPLDCFKRTYYTSK